MENTRLINVKILEFSSKEPDFDLTQGEFNRNNINTKYTAKFLVHPENKQFGCVLDFFYLYDVDNKEETLLTAKIFFEFVVLNLDQTKEIKDLFSDKFVEKIFSISYDTARGMLISQTASTLFNNFYLPIYDVKKEIKKFLRPISKKKVDKNI